MSQWFLGVSPLFLLVIRSFSKEIQSNLALFLYRLENVLTLFIVSSRREAVVGPLRSFPGRSVISIKANLDLF